MPVSLFILSFDFMKKAIAYIVICIFACYVAREILYIGVRKNKIGEYDKLNTVFIKHNNYNAIIIGSSRAESHYNSKILDSITKLNSYNIGISGAILPIVLTSLQCYLANSTPPRYVIMNIDFQTFESNKDTIYNFPRYFPYLGEKTLYNRLSKLDKRFSFFKWIPFYSLPFFNDSYLDAAFRGYLGLESKFDCDYIKGYVSPKTTWSTERMENTIYNPCALILEKDFSIHLDSIINMCKQKNIALVFVASPSYDKQNKSIINFEELKVYLKSKSQANAIPFFDYTSGELCDNKEYFADPMHLNKKGSTLFSIKFSQDFEQYINAKMRVYNKNTIEYRWHEKMISSNGNFN